MPPSPRRVTPSWPRAVLLTALAAALTACGGSRRPAIAPEALEAARAERQAAYEQSRAELVRHLAGRVAAGDDTLDVLVLSGGGQHGAFGAGLLAGWASRTDDPMPTFDIVTGISTGSLQAPWAFLGTPEALARLTELYRHPERIEPRRDLIGALAGRTGGLFDTSRLAAGIGAALTPAIMADLHRQMDAGRRLFVGTTDLRLGRGRVWDVARATTPTADGAERLQRLLMASSAIPGAFPPVDLDGAPHTDGGVTSNLLAADFALLRALADELRVRDARATLRVWALVNLWLAPPVLDVDPGSVRAVNQRANGLMFALAQQSALVRMYEVAEAINATGGALRVEMRHAAIPDSWARAPGAGALFDAAYMGRLQDYATARGRRADAWEQAPPGPFE